MRLQDGRTPLRHPSLEELAALADRCLAPAPAAAVEEHLQACPRCFGTYAAGVEARIERLRAAELTAGEVDLELSTLVRAGLEVAGAETPARDEPAAPRIAGQTTLRLAVPRAVRSASRRGFRGGGRRVLAVGSVAAAALAVFIIVPEVLWRASIAPVREAMAVSSSRGLCYPNVRPSGPDGAGAYRSDMQPAKAGLTGAILRLSKQYEQNPGSWRSAYWLVAARMEADQLPQARSILDGALRRFPQHRWLCLLDGMLAFREGHLEASAAIFDSLTRAGGGDPVAADNLARVRAELGSSDRRSTNGSD